MPNVNIRLSSISNLLKFNNNINNKSVDNFFLIEKEEKEEKEKVFFNFASIKTILSKAFEKVRKTYEKKTLLAGEYGKFRWRLVKQWTLIMSL